MFSSISAEFSVNLTDFGVNNFEFSSFFVIQVSVLQNGVINSFSNKFDNFFSSSSLGHGQ